MEFCIETKELKKALKEIEKAEKNGFMYCLSVFTFVSAGDMIDENIANYTDMIEKAHPTNERFDWGRGQGITKRNKFINGKLVPLNNY
jgi:hypothetical protein